MLQEIRGMGAGRGLLAAARSTASLQLLLLVAIALATCWCISPTKASDCVWKYNYIPPTPKHWFSSPCNPFIDDSMYTVQFQVHGPSEVEFSCYFEHQQDEYVLLTNSTKHQLVSSVNEHNGSVVATLDVTFFNLNKSVDSGNYSCRAKVKESNNLLAPNVSFNLSSKVYSAVESRSCDSIPRVSIANSCVEEIMPSSLDTSTVTTAHSPSSSLGSITGGSVKDTATPSSTLRSVEASPSTFSLTTQTKPLTVSTSITSVSLRSVPATPTNGADSFPSSSSLSFPTPPPDRPTLDNPNSSNSSPLPVNTWFYLLSVIVVLTFLMIILILILVIFCIMKRNNEGRRTSILPSTSTPEEIRVHRVSRLPSDPLPKIIRDNDIGGYTDMQSAADGSNLPSQTFIQSTTPANNGPSNHAMSLQHLVFNLEPNLFQSNSTLYDEIDLTTPPDIVRETPDYINGNRYTLQSDRTSQSYVLPPDSQGGSEDLSYCIEQPRSSGHDELENTADSSVATMTTESDTMETNTTTGNSSEWYGLNQMIIVSQSPRVPWEGNTNTLHDRPIQYSSSVPTDPCPSVVKELVDDGDRTGSGFTDDETEDTTTSLVIQQCPPNFNIGNTLSGQAFDLDSTTTPTARSASACEEQASDVAIIDSRPRPLSTIESINLIFPGTPGNLPGASTAASRQDPFLSSSMDMDDNSRSSSSTSGCTDISKYSGDYDRDPAYMRLLLNRVGPLLPGHTSPETSNDDLTGQEVRADSGMESLYTDPTVTDTRPYPSTSKLYKSLNSLTMDPEPLYSQPMLRPWTPSNT